jgi:hypothetical protein
MVLKIQALNTACRDCPDMDSDHDNPLEDGPVCRACKESMKKIATPPQAKTRRKCTCGKCTNCRMLARRKAWRNLEKGDFSKEEWKGAQIMLDLTGHEYLLAEISDMAREDLRDIKRQIIHILKNAGSAHAAL